MCQGRIRGDPYDDTHEDRYPLGLVDYPAGRTPCVGVLDSIGRIANLQFRSILPHYRRHIHVLYYLCKGGIVP